MKLQENPHRNPLSIDSEDIFDPKNIYIKECIKKIIDQTKGILLSLQRRKIDMYLPQPVW